MQPTYLPWSGYFNLIASVDQFVFLDDVQFERRSWQSRNRICVAGQARLLSVSTVKAPRETLLADIRLSESTPWREQHLAQIREAYRAAPSGPAVLGILEPILMDRELASLVELNMQIITALCAYLEIPTVLTRASELGCAGQRSSHLMAICLAIGAQTYLSPEGSRAYLEGDDFTGLGPVELAFQQYSPPIYSQPGGGEFVSHMSIIDLLANTDLKTTRQFIGAEK